MLHLTHKGVWAGVPYCGKDRNHVDTYQHPAYSERAYQAQLDDPAMCPVCLAEALANEEGDD